MRLDILTDDDGDLLWVDGDLVIGESDQQHVLDILDSQPGETKEFPLCGFGAINYIKTRVTESEFKRDLKIQLNYDGYANPIIDTSEGFEKLNIEI